MIFMLVDLDTDRRSFSGGFWLWQLFNGGSQVTPAGLRGCIQILPGPFENRGQAEWSRVTVRARRQPRICHGTAL